MSTSTSTSTSTSQPAPGPQPLPTPVAAGAPSLVGNTLTFRFQAVSAPGLGRHELTVSTGGRILKQERPGGEPVIVIFSPQFTTPGRYCATAVALPDDTGRALPSAPSAPLCHTVG